MQQESKKCGAQQAEANAVAFSGVDLVSQRGTNADLSCFHFIGPAEQHFDPPVNEVCTQDSTLSRDCTLQFDLSSGCGCKLATILETVNLGAHGTVM